MTEGELNQVRDLKKKIRDLEQRLQMLRMSAENLVPIIDGLPHSIEVKSRVEQIALMIIAAEGELKNLREQIIKAKSELVEKIIREVEAPELQTLLVLRYVECVSLRETARRMHYSLRHTFRLHDKVLKDVIR